MNPPTQPPMIVIEIFGEGPTDIGQGKNEPELPESGVVAILVFRLCDDPGQMRVKRRPFQFLHGKGLWQKVKFAKRQAANGGSAGAVFVIDSEGNLKKVLGQLHKGRDDGLSEFPMAVGVAHPCIESWLLTDPDAIQTAMSLLKVPKLPEKPEELPAPKKNSKRNPKVMLADCCGVARKELSVKEKNRIAHSIASLDSIRTGCPISFQPFADEVLERMKPLFSAAPREGLTA